MGRFQFACSDDFERAKEYLEDEDFDILGENEDTRTISVYRGRQTERLINKLNRAQIGYRVRTHR